MIELLLKALAAYLLGSIVGSLVVGRLAGGIDIRTLGSGNAGGTNALRTQGRTFALFVVLIDVGKGWLAAYAIAKLAIPGVPPAGLEVRDWLPAVCGAAAIVGHIFPLWHGFRGGKGAATLVGALAGIEPWLLVPVLATWLAALVLFGYVSFASILAAAALPLAVLLSETPARVPLLAFGVFVAATVLFTHRANLARIRQGTEPRARTLWLLGRTRR